MKTLKSLILISLLAFNCQAIEKSNVLRMLANDDIVTVAHPPLDTCLTPMKRVL